MDLKEEFEMLEKHKKLKIKFLSAKKLNKNAAFNKKNVSLSDFRQGSIGNCGLIAALASMSRRTEFLDEIAPKVDYTKEGIKFHFKMYCKGKPVTVTIDDKLPFLKPNFLDRLFGKHPFLIYARSLQNNNCYLASLFEKAVVKHACFNSYARSVGIHQSFVFSMLSNCMSMCRRWKKFRTSKHKQLDGHLMFELANKSSVVLCVMPDLFCNKAEKKAHAYTVMDYDKKHKAVKLYNPNLRTFLNTDLPLYITESVNRSKGELWITLDQLRGRFISITSLYSKKMYKSIFEIELKPNAFNKNNLCLTYNCEFNVEQASKFMINVFAYTHEIKKVQLDVLTVGTWEKVIESKHKIREKKKCTHKTCKEFIKGEYYKMFNLKPNRYVFCILLQLRECANVGGPNVLLKIGSTSECELVGQLFYPALNKIL